MGLRLLPRRSMAVGFGLVVMLSACDGGADSAAPLTTVTSGATTSTTAQATSTTNVAQSSAWADRSDEILVALGAIPSDFSPDTPRPSGVFRTVPVDLEHDGVIELVVDLGNVAASSLDPLKPWAFEFPEDLTGADGSPSALLLSVTHNADDTQLIATVQITGLEAPYPDFTLLIY